jgi:hypothetical protein
MQHAAVAATMNDTHLVWRTFDDAQPHLQVAAIR